MVEGHMVLSYAASDGSISTLTFVPGTVDDYNNAVTGLQATADEAARQAEIAAELAAHHAAVDAAATQVQRDLTALDADQTRLRSDLKTLVDIDGFVFVEKL